jgi:hypothetical protein
MSMQKNAGLIILYSSFLSLTSCGLVVRKPQPVLNPALILEEIFVREDFYGVEVDFENEPPYEIPQELLYRRADKLIEGVLSGKEVTPRTIAMFKTRTSSKRVFDYYMNLEEEGWRWTYSRAPRAPRDWDAQAGKDYASCELGVKNQSTGMDAGIIIVRMQMYGRTFIVISYGNPTY